MRKMVKFKVEDANFNKIYPVGSIYMSVNSTDPSELFGGEWEQIEDKFLLACGTNHNNGETGGSETVSLSASQMPRHNHSTNAHSHGTKYGDTSFVVSERTDGASNKRVTTVSSGSTYVPTDTSAGFHHYNATDSQSPSTKYSGGTGSTEAYSDGSAHENMPPYLAVYCWVRIA